MEVGVLDVVRTQRLQTTPTKILWTYLRTGFHFVTRYVGSADDVVVVVLVVVFSVTTTFLEIAEEEPVVVDMMIF